MARKNSFHHVFLSFRGDVRHPFTRFLYKALKKEGLQPFMDKENINPGDVLNKKLQKGIRKSMSAIVIYSKDFASSNSCLDELNSFVDRMKNSKFFILPILYDVSTDQNKENFAAALEKHKEKYGEEKVMKWKEAFYEAKQIFSMHFDAQNIRPEHFKRQRKEFIPKVIKKFRKRFSKKYPEHPLPPSPQIPVENGEHPLLALPQIPIPHGNLDQGASSNQGRILQIQHAPTASNNSTTSMVQPNAIMKDHKQQLRNKRRRGE